MARIRSIKPEFFDSPSTAECSPWARLLYIAMWCLADDWGVGPANMKELAAFAFPNDERWTSKELPVLVKEIASHYQVKFYTNSGRRYFEVPSWDEHQVTQRKAKRRNPAHDAPESVPDKEIYQNQGSSLSTQGKDKYGTGELGTGELGTGEQNTCSPTSSSSERASRFDEFWSIYPRKVGKQKADTKYRAASRRASEQTIIDGAARLAQDPNLPETQFIPHPTTWLERDGWDDEPLPAKRTGSATDRMRQGFQDMSGYKGPPINPWDQKELGQ